MARFLLQKWDLGSRLLTKNLKMMCSTQNGKHSIGSPRWCWHVGNKWLSEVNTRQEKDSGLSRVPCQPWFWATQLFTCPDSCLSIFWLQCYSQTYLTLYILASKASLVPNPFHCLYTSLKVALPTPAAFEVITLFCFWLMCLCFPSTVLNLVGKIQTSVQKLNCLLALFTAHPSLPC